MSHTPEALEKTAGLSPLMPEVYRLQRMRQETLDTFTVELAHASHATAASFRPGQFNMLYVFGVGEIPISISGDPANPNALVHTTRAVGVVTRAMRLLKRGDSIGVRGPFGAGWPVEESEGNDVVIVAGGIGLAPLRPALYQILAHRMKYGRVVLLYGTRSPDDILFQRDLERWRTRFDLEVIVTVDRAAGSWRGNVGVVTTLISRAPFDPRNAVALICGPEIMMRFTAQELRRRGVDSGRIYVSMERNMKCATGFCGHCQFGPQFICKDGPVFPYNRLEKWLNIREV
jgi:NAD(P)H-flavin reductase